MRNSTLTSSCRVLALILACAAIPVNAADKESPDGLTAQQIFDKMVTTYVTCKSYRDSGAVTNDTGPQTTGERFPRHVGVITFRTAFVRPDQFRFEYDDPTPEKPYIIWAKAGEVRTWWYIRPGVETPPSLADAVAGATGVSGASSHTIPTLLLPDLPDRIKRRKLTSMTDLTRLPDEALDNAPCFKLEGKVSNQPTTLWLEKATYLITRIDRKMTAARVNTTVYQPEVNKEIPAKELEFNAPSTR